jgi:proteasome lid subunit RPN8/RPN11
LILLLKQNHIDTLNEESHRAYPIEACGILFGEKFKERAHIRKIIITTNKLQSSTRFEISPEEVVEAFSKAKKEGFEFIGFFHSHQRSPSPSSIDLKYMKLWGNAFWVIFSITNNCLTAFQIKKGKVVEIPLQVE